MLFDVVKRIVFQSPLIIGMCFLNINDDKICKIAKLVNDLVKSVELRNEGGSGTTPKAEHKRAGLLSL